MIYNPSNPFGAMTPESNWRGGRPPQVNPPVRTPTPNYQPPAEDYTKAPPAQPPGGGAGGWEWINGQWGRNLPGAQQTPASAPQSPATGQPGQSQIQTSITPSSIYTPQMTQHAVNQAFADNTPDLRTAMKQYDRPGVSRSAGTVAAALPTVAASQLAQRQAAAEIPLLDEIANQKHLLGGEVAREGQALELGNLLNRLGQTRAQQSIGQGQLALGNQQQGLSLLQQLMGGL